MAEHSERLQGKPRRRLLRALALLCVVGLMVGTGLGFYLLHWALGVTPADLLRQELPHNDPMAADFPSSYQIDFADAMPRQGLNQCAAYATAYLLRYYGESGAEGGAVYEALDLKLSGGYVMPQGIKNFAEDSGYDVGFYRGDIDKLKTRVASGTPVIVLIGRRSYQHYVTVVGYAGDTLYFYDSLEPAPVGAAYYNNSMNTDDFMQVWNNGIPLFQRVYLVIEPVS